jgi:hypothetical protein
MNKGSSIRQRVSLALIFFFVLGLGIPLWPQSASSSSLDGVIAGLTSDALTLTLADGSTRTAKISADTLFLVREAAALQDIKAGDALGVTARRGDDGGLIATAINIFTPELYKTVRKGQFPMQQPGLIMTNALVSQYAQGVEGRLLRMQVDNAQSAISVPEGVNISRIVSLKISDLKTGNHVTVRGTAAADGSISASSINLIRG